MDKNIEPLEALTDSQNKAAFVFAHQDDELPYVGLILRRGATDRFFWLTNGDGLAHINRVAPEKYAQLRLNECKNVRKLLGIDEAKVEERKVSEIEIYDELIEWQTNPQRRQAIATYFTNLAKYVFDFLERDIPDIVFTLAFQGGHPEHDLVSAFAGLSAKRIAKKHNKNIQLVHLPEYEFGILVPLRFKPWYKGKVLSITLTPYELEKKLKVIETYASQKELFEAFRRVINRIGKLSALFGKNISVEEFLKVETFSPVPLDFDYFTNPHRFEWLNYPMDTHRGVRVRFDGMLGDIIAQVAKEIENW